MNYHLMIDDKFINDFIVDAEKAAPNNNVYIISSFKENIKHINSDLVIYAPYHTDLFADTIKNIRHDDKVFIHWASDEAINFVLTLPRSIKVGLYFWGGDIVEIPYSIFKNSIYGPQTLKYFEKYEEHAKVKWNPLKPKRLYRTLANRYWKYNENQQKIFDIRKAFFARLDYFLNWNIIDFDWILHNYKTSASYKYFFYNFNPIPDSDIVIKQTQGKNYTSILLGNSDTAPNNHLEMLDILRKFKDEAIKLVIPLSYGNKEYGDLIEQKAIDIFGKDKVMALRNFMNRDAYYKVLDDVDVAVMNHYRTQAAGNTLALLYRGKKVYIHEVSSTYKLLHNNHVGLGNSANIANESFDTFIKPFSEEIKQKNIEHINQLFRIEEKEAVLRDLLA